MKRKCIECKYFKFRTCENKRDTVCTYGFDIKRDRKNKACKYFVEDDE